MEKVNLIITNPKSGLSKTINAEGYTLMDFMKTFSAYVTAGFSVKIV